MAEPQETAVKSRNFAKFFMTRERFEDFLNQLETVRSEIFAGSHGGVFQLDSALSKYFSKEIVNEITLYLGTEDVHAVDAGIKRLLEDLSSYQLLKLATSIDLSESFIKELFMWVTDNVGDKVILDLRVKPYILGGIEVSFNGRYADLTVRSKLEKVKVTV